MREQVIPQKVGNRIGVAGKGRSAAQRPARRGAGHASVTLGAVARVMLGYAPVVLKLLLAITVGGLIFVGYRSAASARFFQMRNVEVQGTSRASAEAVQTVVRREVGKTGVWQTDLSDLSAKLERLPWIRNAVVSRVLPDGIRVRISERVPRAVVRTTAGRFYWVDDDAVMLGEMLPTDPMPSFFLRGWSEEETSPARKDNSERVRKFLELQRAWDATGLSERVSEVNLVDIRDVRAQLAGSDSQIEVRLGSQDASKRLKDGLEILDKQRQTPRGPFISYIDLSQGKRAIVGFISGAHAISDVSDSNPKSPANAKTGRDAGSTTDRDQQAPAGNTARGQREKREQTDKRPGVEKSKQDRNRRT